MFLDGANFAGDFATPFEPTVTIDARLGRPRFVAPPAAEQLATLDSRWSAVAHPTGRTQRSGDSIRIAEIGRFLRVDQILATRRFDTRHFRNDRLAVISLIFGLNHENIESLKIRQIKLMRTYPESLWQLRQTSLWAGWPRHETEAIYANRCAVCTNRTIRDTCIQSA